MTQNSTKRIATVFAIITVCIVIAVGVLIFLIRYNTHQLAQYELDIREQKDTEETNESMTKLLRTEGESIGKLQNRIVAKEGTISVIEFIESLARGQGLAIQVSGVREEEFEPNKEMYEYLNLTLSAQGSWAGMYRFLAILENLPYKTVLSSAVLGASNEGLVYQTKSLWNGNFSISILKYK